MIKFIFVFMEWVILFFVIVGGCTLIGKLLGSLFFPKSKDGFSSYGGGYIDRSIHHHHNDNRSVHYHGKSNDKSIK